MAQLLATAEDAAGHSRNRNGPHRGSSGPGCYAGREVTRSELLKASTKLELDLRSLKS